MPRNPADRIVRARVREPVHFPDLAERLTLKLSSVLHYTARSHFGEWHRKMGSPDFREPDGVFTPLFYVEVETTDTEVNPMGRFTVRGETYLAKTLDAAGAIDHIVREGHHTVFIGDTSAGETTVARAQMINVFTRYHTDPAQRRVTALPASMGLGSAPSRVIDMPSLGDLVPVDRTPDFAASDVGHWHYDQTDANRHVNGMEYLRVIEGFVADCLGRAGHDLRHLHFTRARIVYRKPCFRGEGYRRTAWVRGEAPLRITGAVFKANDPPTARPAVAIELTVSRHEG